ncbi:MAG: hypothetical protein PHH83_01160 [Patescibacteria group bacterium]|nr:hypothetical protein [Patescibacteria group bacterium]
MKKNIIIAVLAVIVVALTVALLINYKDKIGGSSVSIDQTKLIAYIVSDSRCKDCNDALDGYIKPQLQQMFMGIEFKEYDYSKSDGEKFYKQHKLTLLPSILFTSVIKSDVQHATQYENLKPYLTPNTVNAELLQMLPTSLGANFDPTKEICDNQKDDTGNGKIDCDDSDCSTSKTCRENKDNTLDLFVMSQCPYGTQALDAMKEILNNFKDKIKFNIYYIANQNQDGTFESLHGQPEVDENIRELCAIKYYPENYKYMDYIWCINKEMQSNSSAYKWETCAKDFPKIKTCFNDDEGKQLLSENIKLANELQIGASPTWMANNRYEFSGIDSETVKSNFCKYNSGLAGCENTLSSETTTLAGSCN